MKARVFVTLKSGVLDPQGQAVGRTLGQLGFEEVEDVRIGKYVEISLAIGSWKTAKSEQLAASNRVISIKNICGDGWSSAVSRGRAHRRHCPMK